jgi:hypothetical protein
VLAAADQRVQAFLHGRPLNPLTRLYFPQYVPPDIRHHRFAIVFVRPSNRERNYAVIDLSTTTVVAILTQRDLTGSRTG